MSADDQVRPRVVPVVSAQPGDVLVFQVDKDLELGADDYARLVETIGHPLADHGIKAVLVDGEIRVSFHYDGGQRLEARVVLLETALAHCLAALQNRRQSFASLSEDRVLAELLERIAPDGPPPVFPRAPREDDAG